MSIKKSSTRNVGSWESYWRQINIGWGIHYPAWISTSIIKCELKLLIHSQTSTVASIEVLEWISNFIPHFTGMYNFLSILRLKLIHVIKRGPDDVTRPQRVNLRLFLFMWLEESVGQTIDWPKKLNAEHQVLQLWQFYRIKLSLFIKEHYFITPIFALFKKPRVIKRVCFIPYLEMITRHRG